MDFDELLKPYNEDGRTPEGILKWLQSKNIPQQHIDDAILHVFMELSSGKTFENGHELDQHILKTARDFHNGVLRSHILDLQSMAKPTFWQRVKAVFRTR